MPESEIHVIDTIQKMDARLDESAFGARAQEEDIKRRINTLFGKEEEKQPEDEKEATFKFGRSKDDYETVNEGMTSDTTEAPTTQTKRSALGEEGAA